MRLLGFVTLFAVVVVFSFSCFADGGVPDDVIYDKVRVKLAGDRDVRGTTIQVEVQNGVVTLEGQVFNEKAKKRATKLTKKVKGVKKVINNLTTAPQ